MANLSADLDSFITNQRASTEYPVASGKTFYAGGLVELDASGKLQPKTAGSRKIVGQFVRLSPDGTKAEVREGDIYLNLAASGVPTQDNAGSTVYAASDNEISTSNGAYPAEAGILIALSGDGAIVRCTLETT